MKEEELVEIPLREKLEKVSNKPKPRLPMYPPPREPLAPKKPIPNPLDPPS